MTQMMYPNDSHNYLGIPCGVMLEELRVKQALLVEDPTNNYLKNSIEELKEKLEEVNYCVKH